jgi:hypothetical protein
MRGPLCQDMRGYQEDLLSPRLCTPEASWRCALADTVRGCTTYIHGVGQESIDVAVLFGASPVVAELALVVVVVVVCR